MIGILFLEFLGFCAICHAQEICPRLAYCNVYIQDADLCNIWCANQNCGCYEGTLLTKPCDCMGGISCRQVAYQCICSCGQSCTIPSYDACISPATNAKDCEVQCRSQYPDEYHFTNVDNISICTCRLCQSMSTNNSNLLSDIDLRRLPTSPTPTSLTLATLTPPTLSLTIAPLSIALPTLPSPTSSPATGSPTPVAFVPEEQTLPLRLAVSDAPRIRPQAFSWMMFYYLVMF